MKLLAATCCVLAVAATARASVWEEASAPTETEAGDADDYDAAMDDGDQATRLAASQSSSSSDARKLVERAARSYERAATIRPDRAEPHWRAAMVLFTLEADCPAPNENTILCDALNDLVDVKLFRRILKHWDEAERLDPLDPRVKTILFERAIVHTKLATDEDLAAARDDYEKALDTYAPILAVTQSVGRTLGNLSETYMMLGDLDHAISSYLETIRLDTSTSQMYGLAIAYDRDEQGAKAKEIIAALGEDAADIWAADVEDGTTFYVPEGEVFYYKALVHEALGHDKEAVIAWKRYLESGAHPQFQPRAQDHLDKLRAKLLSQATAKAAILSAGE